MFEQLTQIVNEYGKEAVVQNNDIPNELNEAVLKETNNSIFSSLQKMISGADLSQFADLLKSDKLNHNNPAIKEIINSVSSSLSEKFGLSSTTSSGAATTMIPQILNSLIGKAKDPKDSNFNLSDLANALTGGDEAQNYGIMEAISTYGIHFGLDQNADGKVDIEDAIELSKKGGISGIFNKLFGK